MTLKMRCESTKKIVTHRCKLLLELGVLKISSLSEILIFKHCTIYYLNPSEITN